MMRKRFSIPVVFGLLIILSSAGFGFSISRSKVIFKKGSDTWVKTARSSKKMRPLDHPQEFSAEDMDRVLASLRYFRPDTFSLGSRKGKEYEVFTEEERKLISAPLAEAFAQVGSEEWVDFSVNTFRGPMLIGSFRQTDGVMFVKQGKLNVALRNIAVKTSPEESVNTYDPTRGYRSMTKLVAVEGLELYKDNWVTLDPENLPRPPAPEPEKAAASPPLEMETPAPEASVPAPAASAPAAQPPAYAPPPPPAQPAPYRPVKERLLELQELYDEGLITEEEYQRKRENILRDL